MGRLPMLLSLDWPPGEPGRSLRVEKESGVSACEDGSTLLTFARLPLTGKSEDARRMLVREKDDTVAVRGCLPALGRNNDVGKPDRNGSTGEPEPSLDPHRYDGFRVGREIELG